MIGDVVRPPCVVTAPYSSVSDRSHRIFPSGDTHTSCAATVNRYTLPVSGSTAGDAHEARCCGTSLRYRLKRRSHTTLPVSASIAMSRSCVSVGSPGVGELM